MEDDSKGEDVAKAAVGLEGVCGLEFQDLRGHVAGSAAARVQILGAGDVLSQTQIDDDRDDPARPALFPLDHDVLELEVAVHYAFAVQVGHAFQKIRHYGFGLLKAREPEFLEVTVQR